MTIPFSCNVTIPSEILTQEVDGETVLLDLRSEKYFGLDVIGTRVWQLVQEKKNVQQVFDALLDEYDVDATQLEKDLDELLNMLANEGLISLS